MTGMGRGASPTDPLIVNAFHHALWLQFILVVGIVAAFSVFRSVLRARQFASSPTASGPTAGRPSAPSTPTGVLEPLARRVLRIGFGLLWILDGVLQGQSSMPLGLPSQVIGPAGASSPSWVQHITNFGITAWAEHPVTAAAAAVWIQVGIGVMLLVAPAGRWSRFAGGSSAIWGLIVWVFGEAFGGIFAPGLTWLFGAPGAVLFYVVAGVLVALPLGVWRTPALGRWLLRALGAFFIGMALLQAWPGRGFWRGGAGQHQVGTLAAMVGAMGNTPQPNFVAAMVRAFADFDAAHGWAVNLFVVVALSAIGAGLLVARPAVTRWAIGAAVVLCLADWIFVEDFGFFGGTGTDPNSMVPLGLLLAGGYLALARVPTATEVTASTAAPASVAEGALPRRRSLEPTYLLRAGAAVGALAIVLVGAVPMAVASASSSADPIVQEALSGIPAQEHVKAPGFALVDQFGRPRTLGSFRGRTMVVTFLDPVCTSDCPVIAQELRAADHMLGTQMGRVALVAIVANPVYTSTAFTRAFDRQEYLTGLANWYFLTGSAAQLTRTWDRFGASALVEPAGAMVDHSEFAMVIDGRGYIRTVLSTYPGPATAALRSSFASLLDAQLRSAMASSSQA